MYLKCIPFNPTLPIKTGETVVFNIFYFFSNTYMYIDCGKDARSNRLANKRSFKWKSIIFHI